MKAVGLFAGIGGFEYGLARSGFEASLLCEIDDMACAVLEEHFPTARICHDIQHIGKLPRGTEIVCAGFPCQDLSSSGRKDGIDGGRSSLVRHVFRLLESRPVEWVLIENVPFMLQLRRGKAIEEIVSSLESLGYRWAYRVIDSQHFGVPQRRRRVFVLASRNHNPCQVLLADDRRFQDPNLPRVEDWVLDRPIGFYWTEGTYATGLALDALPPLKGGSAIGIPSPPAVLMPQGAVATPNIKDAERLQGFPADWTIPVTTIGRPSLRWKLVGNAVTTNVAQWIGHRLRTPREYVSRSDLALGRKDAWPKAAWGGPGIGRFAARVGAAPVRRNPRGLSAFLRFPVKPLSKKATEGFLARAERGTLSFPRGFLKALRDHAALV